MNACPHCELDCWEAATFDHEPLATSKQALYVPKAFFKKASFFYGFSPRIYEAISLREICSFLESLKAYVKIRKQIYENDIYAIP